MKPTGNSSEKIEWRIKPIHYRDPYAKMDTNWGAVLGALFFIGGIIAGLKISALFSISIFGLILALISILFRGRMVRRHCGECQHSCRLSHAANG